MLQCDAAVWTFTAVMRARRYAVNDAAQERVGAMWSTRTGRRNQLGAVVIMAMAAIPVQY